MFNANGCDFFWNISGKAYYDGNNNCLQDGLDVSQGNVKIELRSNGNLVQETFTSEGFYSFDTDSFATYSVSVDTSNIPFYVSCPANNLLFDTITAIDSFDYSRDFALRCKPGFDLTARSIHANRLHPANFALVDIHAGDLSNFYGVHCAAGVSGTVTTTITGPVSFIAPAAGALVPIVSGNVLTYNIADFGNVNFNNDFNIIVQTDTTAAIGSSVCFTVSVAPTAGDNNPANNTLTHCFTVVGSYDPNNKDVYPMNGIAANDWLTYTINFQNTGTDTAQHIYITDTLDAAVDESTFQLLSYNHQPMVQITGNAVRFNFPNINLPDSNTNEAASHGYVVYKVRVRNNVPANTAIHNTANIYFDFNAPVITNTTTNTVLCSSIITPWADVLCNGISYDFNGTLVNAAGVYRDTLTAANGCDSIIELTLTSLATSSTLIAASICDNEQYSFAGFLLNTVGIYYDTLTNSNGCDSIIELTLTVHPSSAITPVNASICEGDVYPFGSMLLNTAGVYYDSLSNSNGCDSVVQLTLSVRSTSLTSIGDGVCENKPYNFNGNVLNQPGLYFATLTNTNGCDSVIALTLYSFSSSYTTVTLQICQGDTFYFHNIPLAESGTYEDTLVNITGCDSIVTLQLDVIGVTYGITHAGSDTLIFNGNGSVRWKDCSSGVVSSDTSRIFVPGIIGSFAAIVTSNGCSDTSQCFAVGFDAIAGIANEAFEIYPNPAGDFAIIKADESFTGSTICLMDARGRKVTTAMLQGSSYKVETRDYEAGMYFVTLSSPAKSNVTRKLVIGR